ncbi:MAG: hypothetical protein ABL936_00415 [Aestuariivirga sp.]
MPFNGAGIFSRTPGTRIANQGALVSAQVNDETDNLVDGVNGKVNLDGLLTYTGLHTLFGDGTALLHQASVRQVQNGVVGHATAVAGTVDAIQVTMAPANTTLTTHEKIRWKSAGANTIVAPTLSKDGGVTNKTIKKGASAALAVGDLGASGQENEATYNGTDWILTNAQSAGSSLTAASTTEVLTGTDTTKYVTPDAAAALWEKGSDIASAGTISVGEGGTFDVTGTTTITDIDCATDKAGRRFSLVHEGIHILTHNGSTMINLTGADITTAVGDISTWQSEGSDVVRMIGYSRADGSPLVAGGTWTSVFKTADQSRTNTTTLADDSTLVFTALASGIYTIRAKIFGSADAAPDVKFSLVGPSASGRSSQISVLNGEGGPTSEAETITASTTYISSTSILIAGVNRSFVIDISATITVGGSGGTVAFQWAQVTSSANNTTIGLGSYIEYRKLN